MADSNKEIHPKKSENVKNESKNERTAYMEERAREAQRARDYEISLLDAKIALVFARLADPNILRPSPHRVNLRMGNPIIGPIQGENEDDDEERDRMKRRKKD